MGNSVIELVSRPTKISGVHYVQVIASNYLLYCSYERKSNICKKKILLYLKRAFCVYGKFGPFGPKRRLLLILVYFFTFTHLSVQCFSA